MTYKSIFLPLAFQQTTAEVTDFALTLAAAFNAHLLAHHVRQLHDFYPPADFYPADDGAIAKIMSDHDEATAAMAQSIKTVFEARCETAKASIVPEAEALKQNGVTASWRQEIGYPAQSYGLAARTSDLVIMAMPDAKKNSLERDVFEAILFQSGAPVLLIPRSGLDKVPQRPLVAWDGSLQASRSVRAALPLLAPSTTTTLLTVGETDTETPPIDVTKLWLERCGVTVAEKAVDWPHGPVAERILNQCEATNSDLIVMGGYSHSRLRESVIGGVTRDILHHGKYPLLMVH
ncbi:universal stress protein [Henriciella aquimarina]|uniref:universal stress protein n=1 Tax=Henriciella aquimarina TaxID=545261 RepID=UPI000A031909|nr:universal stress protein [Henriciella aquimarina]